jgi:hypothetical protein
MQKSTFVVREKFQFIHVRREINRSKAYHDPIDGHAILMA